METPGQISAEIDTGRKVGDRSALLPLSDGFRVDPEALRQRPQARLTMLYRSTDCLCRRGAPMKNLAHSASFQSFDKDAPSKPGTKHLVTYHKYLCAYDARRVADKSS